MKTFWKSIKITLAFCALLGVGYVLILWGVGSIAGPNGGRAAVVTENGRIVGAANVGQSFTKATYFWPSFGGRVQRERFGRQQQGYDQPRIPR